VSGNAFLRLVRLSGHFGTLFFVVFFEGGVGQEKSVSGNAFPRLVRLSGCLGRSNRSSGMDQV